MAPCRRLLEVHSREAGLLDALDWCEANNRKCSLNTARPMPWGYTPDVLKQLHDEKTITVVGSFSSFDWIGAEMCVYDQ